MKPSDFVHLHCHSTYSLLEGLPTPEEIVQRAKELGQSAVGLADKGYTYGLIEFYKAAKEQGLNATLVGGDALVTQEFWSITGKAGQGTFMTFDADPRKNPIAQPVVQKFRAQGYDPEGYTLYTYAAIQTFKQAAEKTKSIKLDDLINALRSTAFDTMLGKISFDQKGDVTSPAYRVYAWAEGKYDYATN